MSTKHTPGPWTFSRWDEGGYTRFYIAQQEGAPYTPDYSDVATIVAETVSGERVAVQEANASLIAAAPELLEAVVAQHDIIDRLLAMLISADPTFMPTKSQIWPLIEKVGAVQLLAKATGAA